MFATPVSLVFTFALPCKTPQIGDEDLFFSSAKLIVNMAFANVPFPRFFLPCRSLLCCSACGSGSLKTTLIAYFVLNAYIVAEHHAFLRRCQASHQTVIEHVAQGLDFSV